MNVFEIWKGWHFVGDLFKGKVCNTLQFDECEEKWVSSTNTNPYKPTVNTSFKNLYLAGAYVKSSVDLYSMETACATGRDAAFSIIYTAFPGNAIPERFSTPFFSDARIRENGIRKFSLNVDKPKWMYLASKIDDVLYMLTPCKNGIVPNIVDVFIILMVLIVLKLVLKKMT